LVNYIIENETLCDPSLHTETLKEPSRFNARDLLFTFSLKDLKMLLVQTSAAKTVL
jgi:hypothetical protein